LQEFGIERLYGKRNGFHGYRRSLIICLYLTDTDIIVNNVCIRPINLR
jgi:hypothetical protein